MDAVAREVGEEAVGGRVSHHDGGGVDAHRGLGLELLPFPAPLLA